MFTSTGDEDGNVSQLPADSDGVAGYRWGSSAHAQKSRTRSPGRLNAAGARASSCDERDERLGSQPKSLPVATAISEEGAYSWSMSMGICCSGDEAARERAVRSRKTCCMLGALFRCRLTVSNMGDATVLHISPAVVMIAMVLGSDTHGDQTVNVEGFGTESELSTISLRKVLRATEAAVCVETIEWRKLSVTMQTSSWEGAYGKACKAALRWSHVRQQVGMANACLTDPDD